MSPQNELNAEQQNQGRQWLPRHQVYGQWDPEDDIVIAGISGRFPESENVEEFMNNLYEGIDMIQQNERRWPIGFANIPGVATLKDCAKFDATYFGIPPKLVTVMDPQLRIVLELTYEALVDAGVNPAEIRGSNTGVYYAVTGGDADHYWAHTEDRANGYGFLGSCKSMFANRISFQYDLTGPSFAVDTGCATSLVALNQAITDMRVCRVDAAIVCSSNLMLNPYYTQHLYKLGVLSPQTESKVFDVNASGYVRAEAAVVLYLVRKSAARRVYANIVHVRNNTDGYKVAGIATPSGERQYENNSALYKEAGIDPAVVGYVEAHGTGTRVGDPEELNSLTDLFCRKRSGTLLVGSLKSNMGHSESPAGLCSLVKVVLALQTGLIPPNLNYKDPTPDVPALFDGRVKIVDKVEPLPGDYVGVNAFGLGGSNSHVLLKRHDKVKSSGPQDQLPRLVTVSGRTEAAVNFFLDKIENTPRDDDFVALLHDIHKKNISKHSYRGYTILNTKHCAREVAQVGEENRPIWFVCTGWGAQWMGKTKELMQFQPFERRIRMCSKVLEKEGINLYDIITKDSEDTHEDVITIFTTVAATQLALIDLLRSIGIKPDALVGISTGELTCAYIDGAVTADQVMQVAYHTAKWAKHSTLVPASMAAVCGLTYEEVQSLCPQDIYVAVHNDFRTCTVVGPEEKMPNFINSLLDRGIVAKSVKSSARIAFHTPLIAKEAEALSETIHKLIPGSAAPASHWVSSSVKSDDGLVHNFTARYYMDILTEPVLVQEALMHIPDNAVVLEISPHSALQLTLRKVLPQSALSLALMSRDEPSQSEFMLSALGRMYNTGIQMNLVNLYPKVTFPVPRGTQMINSMVQWEHSMDWTVPNMWYKPRKDGSRPNKCSFVVDPITDKDMYLKGHVVNQQQMYPYAGYLQLVWRAFAQVNEGWYESFPVKMENVEFLQQTLLPESGTLTFIVKFPHQSEDSADFELYETSRLLATGSITKMDDSNEEESVQILEPTAESELLPLTSEDIYTDFRLRGFQYTGRFCSVINSDNRGTSGTVEWHKNWVTFLDALLQFAQIGQSSAELLLPKRLQRISINLQEHQKSNEETLVQMRHEANLLKAGGVTLQGLQFCSEHKVDEEQRDPEIEKQIFIPYMNKGIVSLGDSEDEAHYNALTVLIQILQENIGPARVKNIVEIGNSCTEHELVSPILLSIMKTQPECKANMRVVSDTLKESSLLESLNITLEETATNDKEFHLLISHSREALHSVSSLLRPGIFLLVLQEVQEISGFSVITTQHFFNSSYTLLRKDVIDFSSPEIVKVSNSDFKWLKELQGALKTYRKAILVSEGENQCGVMGLHTCIMREPGGDKISCVFVQDQQAPNFSLVEPLYSDQLEKDLRVNVYRDGMWGSLRHLNLNLQNCAKQPTEFAKVELLSPGDLSTISWVETPLKYYSTERDEDLCYIYYTSVAAKDAVDITTRKSKNSSMGQEFSGYNSSGKRVMGLVPGGALATQVLASPSMIWNVPPQWSLEQAATVPSAYATGYYALNIRGRLQKDEWVLIHPASSPVSQAAIKICLQSGCHVITTVQTEEERKKFQSSGLHVVLFRQLESHVLALTGGRGVDVVLSILQSEDQRRVLAQCLAEEGRFLDLAQPRNRMGMPILHNKTYQNIQLDSLFRDKNTNRELVVGLLTAGIESGTVTPLPALVLPETEMEQAFKQAMESQSSEKIIIRIHKEKRASVVSEKNFVTAVQKLFVDPEKVYILIGGVGGFGIELAKWLVQRGAKKLMLTSRRGVTSGYKSLQIRRWRDAGVTVITSTQDVTAVDGAATLLQRANQLGPVGGIFVLSMVLRDFLTENQTEENFQEVCKAKVDVTRSLDTTSQKHCLELDYFVVFSSVVCGRGNAGQAPYGMANSAMERICEERVKEGLPGLALQWGPVGDVGVMFTTVGNDAVLAGTIPQHIGSCLKALEKILLNNQHHKHPVVTSHVLLDREVQSESPLVKEKDFLSTVANVLGIKDMSTMNPNADAEDLGIDSLMRAEIKNSLQEQFSVNLSSQQIYSLMAASLKEQAA